MTKFSSLDPDPLFTVHMIIPTSGPIQIQERYVPIIKEELYNIGIDSELNYISWAGVGLRVTKQEVGQYSEGGYDICFFGMSLGTPAKHPGDVIQANYGSTAIPPAGYNVMYWAPGTDSFGRSYMNYRANESNQLIREINEKRDLTEVKEDLKTWQKIWYDVMPNVLIYNQYEVQAISTGLYGYDPVRLPLNSIEDVWLTNDYPGTIGEVVLAANTGGDTFNPLLITDVYDQYGSNPAFDGLVGNTPSIEVVLPTGIGLDTWMMDNYNTTKHMTLYPRVAAAMGTWASNGLSYDMDIRENVYFHDGEKVDAWDVAFSFQARLVPILNPYLHKKQTWYDVDWLKAFGYDDKSGKHGNYSFIVTDENNDSFFEHIKFTLNQIFVPFETECLGTFLLPEHILGDPVNHGFNSTGDFDPVNQWIVKPVGWQYHSTTTGRTTDPGGYPGPISCGSMIFESYNSTTSIVTLKKFENIKWDNATGAWVTDNTINHWNIASLGDMPDTAKVIVASMDSTIADMKTGEVNIMDPQFYIAHILDELQTEATIQIIFSTEPGWEGMWLNPKFEQDGDYHLNKKGVRHAISHIIPRQKIIDEVIRGLACPAYTPLPQNSWAALPEDELITYKQSLTATDGSTPDSGATTAYDSYNISLALDWLETEGYDVSFWRNGPTSSSKISPEIFSSFDVLIIIPIGIVLIASGIGLALLFARLRRIK